MSVALVYICLHRGLPWHRVPTSIDHFEGLLHVTQKYKNIVGICVNIVIQYRIISNKWSLTCNATVAILRMALSWSERLWVNDSSEAEFCANVVSDGQLLLLLLLSLLLLIFLCCWSLWWWCLIAVAGAVYLLGRFFDVVFVGWWQGRFWVMSLKFCFILWCKSIASIQVCFKLCFF